MSRPWRIIKSGSVIGTKRERKQDAGRGKKKRKRAVQIRASVGMNETRDRRRRDRQETKDRTRQIKRDTMQTRGRRRGYRTRPGGIALWGGFGAWIPGLSTVAVMVIAPSRAIPLAPMQFTRSITPY